MLLYRQANLSNEGRGHVIATLDRGSSFEAAGTFLQAGENAQQARKWIDSWRAGNAASASSPPVAKPAKEAKPAKAAKPVKEANLAKEAKPAKEETVKDTTADSGLLAIEYQMTIPCHIQQPVSGCHSKLVRM